MNRKLYLGIEGGATRTTGVLADGELNVVAEAAAGPTNLYAVDEPAARAAVSEILASLRDAAAGRWADVAASAFCIAGVRTEADRERWRRVAAAVGAPGAVLVTHDAAAALAAGSDDLTGVLVVCGTGSLAYARRADGAERFVGGRGPVLGDEGSGFDIGRRGLRAAVRAAEGRGPATRLEGLIPQSLHLAGVDDLVAYVSPFAKDRVAAVAPIVFDAAAGGDSVALAIVQRAAADLAAAATTAARALWPGGDGPARVVLAGGILREQGAFRQTLTALLADAVPSARCVPPGPGPLGAARIAGIAETHRNQGPARLA